MNVGVPVLMAPLLIFLIFFVLGILTLFIILVKKNPKLAIALIFVPLVLILSLVLLRLGKVQDRNIYPDLSIENRIEPIRVSSNYREYPTDSSPIWSEGMEKQFEANIYPSRISALRALAPQVVKQIPYVMGELTSPEMIVIYSSSLDLEEVEQFRQTLEELTPEINNRIEIGNFGLNPKEIGIRFSIGHANITTINASIFAGQRQRNVSIKYADKPWVEDFASYVNSKPNRQFIIAKSSEACLSEIEASRQAMDDACKQVKSLLPKIQNFTELNYNFIFSSNVTMDTFMQSFEGSAGKIWRMAILLDVSPDKLTRLTEKLARNSRDNKMNWARTILSIIGLLVLITIVYAFLNAATKGYYTWSLRIVGIILAGIILFIILTIS